MTDPFLAGLPAPKVIEELSFEAIYAAMKVDLIARFPDIGPILALESSAAVKVGISSCTKVSSPSVVAWATGDQPSKPSGNQSGAVEVIAPPVARGARPLMARYRSVPEESRPSTAPSRR